MATIVVNTRPGVFAPVEVDPVTDGWSPTAADKYQYSTGAGTAVEGDITAAGRALLDDADATAQRVTLGMTDGQLPATATNDSAAAGKVGEWQEASSSGVSIGSSGAQVNATSLSLTAGDWDVQGHAAFTPTGNCTFFAAGLNTTSATVPSFPNGGIVGFQQTSSAIGQIMITATVRFSLATTTTIHLAASATFSSGSMSVAGTIRARRAR